MAVKAANSISDWTDALGISKDGALTFGGVLGFAAGALGDFANLAAANAQLEKAQKKFAKDIILIDNREGKANLKRDADREKEGVALKSYADIRRVEGEATGKATGKLQAELDIQAKANEKLVVAQKEASRLASERLQHTEAYKDAMASVKQIQDEITSSHEKQRAIIQEQSREHLAVQEKIRSNLTSELQTQKQLLDNLNTGTKTAALNFAKLGTIEKQQAIDALKKAQTTVQRH